MFHPSIFLLLINAKDIQKNSFLDYCFFSELFLIAWSVAVGTDCFWAVVNLKVWPHFGCDKDSHRFRRPSKNFLKKLIRQNKNLLTNIQRGTLTSTHPSLQHVTSKQASLFLPSQNLSLQHVNSTKIRHVDKSLPRVTNSIRDAFVFKWRICVEVPF